MSQAPSNNVMQAVIQVTADASAVPAQLDQAKAEAIGKINDVGAALRTGIATAVAASAFEVGKIIGETVFETERAAKDVAELIQQQAEITERFVSDKIKELTAGLKGSGYDLIALRNNVKELADLEKQIKTERAAQGLTDTQSVESRKDLLRTQHENLQIQNVAYKDAVEALNRILELEQRRAGIASQLAGAQERSNQGREQQRLADENAALEKETRELTRENERIARDAKRSEDEERRQLQIDLREDQRRRDREARDIESAARVAKAVADAAQREMSRALAGIAQQFNTQFDLRQMTQTLEALSANVEKIANQRRAAGL